MSHVGRSNVRGGRCSLSVVLDPDAIEALDYLFAARPLAALDRHAPAVVLLDLNLPSLDGVEMLRRLRNDPRTRALPGVVKSTSAQEEGVTC